MDNKENVTKYATLLERASWILVFFGMLTQISSDLSFPSYNIVLGFWGAYCSFSKHGRATFGSITFTFISIILDIAFCSVNQSVTSVFQFALAMFILCIFSKLFLLWAASHFFAAIGGAYSMESSMTASVYDNLVASGGAEHLGGGYYPPDMSQGNIHLQEEGLGQQQGGGIPSGMLQTNQTPGSMADSGHY